MNLIEQLIYRALATPSAIAHISGDQRLKLARPAPLVFRRLLRYLAKRFGDDRSPIAVLGHRDADCISGGGKIPQAVCTLDTVLPQQRIGTKSGNLAPRVTSHAGRPRKTVLCHVPEEVHDPFYILFTSGSTGERKALSLRLDAWSISSDGCLRNRSSSL